VISGLLDEWEPKGAFDFEEFASHFPITVMCKLMGVSPVIIPSLRSSLEAMGLGISMNPDLLDNLNAAFETLDAAAQGVIDEREASWMPGDEDDLLDLLMEAKAQGGMSRRELADIIVFLLVGGFDTSKNMLTLVMYELVDRPEDYARCAEDLEFCGSVVDEAMRIHGASNTNRLVTQDIDYRDVRIPAGTVLWFPWGVIGRDPSSAEDPDEFDPHKTRTNPHVGFGLGPHICLGKFIARTLLSEGVHLIAQRIRQPRSSGPQGWRPFLGVWGIRGLPIQFQPA
jgi:cytochrome P450